MPKKSASTRATARSSTRKAKAKTKKSVTDSSTGRVRASKLPPKATQALKKAEEALWSAGVAPHALIQVLHENLLLRCLKEAKGNYAGAAEIFGPSRQSVQQFANSPLRDSRWKPYQQNRRKKK